MICGFGVYKWANGKVYEGYWKDNKMNGKGKVQYPDKSSYEGDFKEDMKDG